MSKYQCIGQNTFVKIHKIDAAFFRCKIIYEKIPPTAPPAIPLDQEYDSNFEYEYDFVLEYDYEIVYEDDVYHNKFFEEGWRCYENTYE